MKIKRIKFYQSIKCNSKNTHGKNEYGYIDGELDGYDLEYKNGLICIENKKSKEQTFTGMHNVVYFNPVEE